MRTTVLHDNGIAPESAASVRDHLSSLSAVLALPRDVQDDLALVATELVTNALRAGSTQLRVAVEDLDAHRVQLQVTDDAPGAPRRLAVKADAISGRGLMIVAALASDWGFTSGAAGRKTVWATLSY